MPPLTTESLANEKTGNTVVETPTVKLIKNEPQSANTGWNCCGGGLQRNPQTK